MFSWIKYRLFHRCVYVDTSSVVERHREIRHIAKCNQCGRRVLGSRAYWHSF